MTKKTKETLATLGLIVGIPAWVALTIYDWKLSIIIFFMFWANNMSMKTGDL